MARLVVRSSEQAQRDDRLDGDPRLHVDRGGDDGDTERDQQRAGRRDPVELVAGERHPHQQDRDAGDDQRGAEVVDRHLPPDHGQVQRLLQQDERHGGDRQADEEAAAPAQRAVHDQAADERPAHGRQREHGADVAGVAAALARRHHRGDHDLDQRGQAADAEALDDTGADQHLHVRGEAGQQRADRVDDERALHQQLLAEQVGELAPDRGGRGHRQQRGDDDPGVAGLAAVQVGDDPRERVAHHGARQHRDEHGEEEAAEGLQHLAVRHLARVLGCCGRRVGAGGHVGGGSGWGGHGCSIHGGKRLPMATIFPPRRFRYPRATDTVRGAAGSGRAATRRRGPQRRTAPVDVMTGSPAGRVSAVNSPAVLR